MNLKLIATRAIVTTVEVSLAAILASGLTDLTADGLALAALAGAAGGLSVIYNALHQWLEQSETVKLVKALRAERARQRQWPA